LQTSDIRKICEAPGAVREPYGAVTGTSPRFMTKSRFSVTARRLDDSEHTAYFNVGVVMAMDDKEGDNSQV
jgi:hypothetical protein